MQANSFVGNRLHTSLPIILPRLLNIYFLLYLLKVSEDDFVKVAGFGASEPAVDITGTIAGTPVYIAPEVFHSEVYDCKADIYSLGITLWEMWYGQQAFANMTAKLLVDFFASVDEGYRPEPVTNCKQPPGRWDQLMKQCWAKNPEERPTAEKCHKEVTELSAEVVMPLN